MLLLLIWKQLYTLSQDIFLIYFVNLQVIDALELAFQELDSEESVNVTMDDNDAKFNGGHVEENVTDTVDKLVDFDIEKKVSVTPLYENIDIFNQNNIVDAGEFPLDLPTNALEPPKEKPPPPPMEDSLDDELLGNVSIISFTILHTYRHCNPDIFILTSSVITVNTYKYFIT